MDKMIFLEREDDLKENKYKDQLQTRAEADVSCEMRHLTRAVKVECRNAVAERVIRIFFQRLNKKITMIKFVLT